MPKKGSLVNGYLHSSFMFFTLIFGDNFLLLILANCFRDESCREKLAPISANGSIIQDAQSSNKLR